MARSPKGRGAISRFRGPLLPILLAVVLGVEGRGEARRDARPRPLRRAGWDEIVRDGRSVERGRWYDPYTDNTYFQPSDVDVNHVVPLANAWRSGADWWGTPRRERFANVPRDLLSVEDNANASKGDKGPEAWKPPGKAYWCTYSKKWINIKHYWSLSVTGAEKRTPGEMLGTC